MMTKRFWARMAILAVAAIVLSEAIDAAATVLQMDWAARAAFRLVSCGALGWHARAIFDYFGILVDKERQ